MRDPYTILGVSKTASEAEIKSAYRKLAKKLHPDANKHDANAASRFSELNAAYEIVGDDDKRKAFDRGEIDGEGKPRFQGFPGGGQPGGGFRPGGGSPFESFSFGSDGFQRGAGGPGAGGAPGAGGFEDLLRGMFGGRASPGGGARGWSNQFEPEDFGSQAAGQAVQASLTISLPDAVKGAKTRGESADRQGHRGQDSGRHRQRSANSSQGAGLSRPVRTQWRRHHHRQYRRRIRCSNPTATICGSICR